MTVELTHSEKQFILYTKGWFVQSENRIKDIKKIVGAAYALDPKDMEMYSVIHFVTNIFDKLMQDEYIPTEGHSPMYYILNNIFKYDLKREDESLLNFICARIANCKSRGLSLGEPDSKYLSIKEITDKHV